MSSKKQIVPAIRFKGYADDWEQRKLETLVDKIKSYSLSREVETSEYTGYKYIHYGDIHTKVANVIDESSTLPNIRAGNYDLLDNGDLVLADASEDYQGIAMPAVVTMFPPYKLVAGLHTIALRPTSADPMFLYYLIRSPIFRKYGYKIGTGMKVFGISATNVLKFESKFPSVHEQEKIGKLLKKMDDTIALHQRQLYNYKELKKAIMQKIFNQELCFKDEEGNEYPEWEEKKVSDLFSITRGVVISKPSISEYKSLETPYPVFSSQTSNFGILGWSSEYDFEGLYLTWTTDGAGAGKVFSRTGKFRCTNVCGVLVGKIESYSNSCIKELLEKETPKHVSYVGNPKLMNNVMGQIKITVPSLKEQLAISGLFELFDRKILFQENLIEKLREQKEGLMQQMFV